MKKFISIIAVTLSFNVMANQMERIHELGGQMCDKAFQCTQGEFDKAAKQMPQMSDYILGMKKQFAQQCKAQYQNKFLAPYSDPKQVDRKLLNLVVACLEKQAKAGCEFYTGEQDFEQFPECKAVNEYHDSASN